MPARLRLVAVAALVAIAFAGCGGGDDSASSSDGGPKKETRKEQLRYRAAATGDVAFAIDKTTEVGILTIQSSDPGDAAVTLLSVGPLQPIDLGDGRLVRVAFDLQRFKGDGSYKIRSGSPKDVVEEQSKGADINTLDQSNVLVQLWTAGPQQPPTVFDRMAEPCELTVAKSAGEGHLKCPSVTNDGGQKFSLDMRWSEP